MEEKILFRVESHIYADTLYGMIIKLSFSAKVGRERRQKREWVSKRM